MNKPVYWGLPRYIALCGHPKSGKSLVQEILQRDYDVQPIDDGKVLRDIAMEKFGAQWQQVYTQEGKASLAHWPNNDPIIDAERNMHMTWRQVLGRVGAKLEELLGEEVMPMFACAALPPGGYYSFGSVRKTQGAYYVRQGGIVIEIRNPLAKPSGNDFDLYDESLITHTIENDALDRGLPTELAVQDLTDKIRQLVVSLPGIKKAA